MSALALAPRALYEQVAEQLRQRIFRRELEPGSWIDEVKLAHEYGISRTPLREALKVLAAEGLVTMKVRRGAYVTEVSERDLAEVYHLLGLLESDAAAAVARNASEDDLVQLEALHRQLETAAGQGPGGAANFLQLNLEFHARLIAIADNRWRTQVVNDLRKMTRLQGHTSMFKAGRIEQALAEHGAVLAALRARDPDAAMQRMREHFQSGFEAAL
jgi:DNA-binding GntR family transcriptional regulator